MKPTCETCKYKGQIIDDSDIYDPGDEPKCEKDYFLCTRIEHIYKYDPPMVINQAAYIVDGSDYYAALRVTDDFACSEYKENQK
jgi:hypothetical protein